MTDHTVHLSATDRSPVDESALDQNASELSANTGPPAPRGRSAAVNTPNRFEPLHLELDDDLIDPEQPYRVPTQYFVDSSRSVLAANDSPDVGFRFSLNPYRGCEHGCIYCYARPSHEYLGFSAGLDFETRILVKEDAPQLLAQALSKKSWVPQPVALSGNTDCYQPVERHLKLTRQCLEVFLEYGNPVTIITKNHLVTRDADLLQELARDDLVHVTLSVTSLRPELTSILEPRTSRPKLRLKAIDTLADIGIPVGVNVAPLIPGLNDEEIPAILKACSHRGARWANYIMVRLPGQVRPLFVDWLERNLPERARKVIGRIREVRDGQLSDPRFGSRLRGQGQLADLVAEFFEINRRRCGFDKIETPPLATDRRPGNQLELGL